MDDDREHQEPGSASTDTGDEIEAEPTKLPTHVAGTLCYLLSFASGVIFLILEPDERSVRFHAFQSILLGAVVLILQVGIWILGFIPPLGWLLGEVLRWIVGLAWVLLTVFLMAKAYSGETYQLPYLGPRANRLAAPY